MKRLEALADAIISRSFYTDPESAQYQHRNPLGLRAFCRHHVVVVNCEECKDKPLMHKNNEGTHLRRYDDKTGMRIFDSHIQGYTSGLYDLEKKCTGNSYSKVQKCSSIRELMRSYYLPDGTAESVARFLRKALHDESISEHTPIEYFVSEKGGANGCDSRTN
jgi:hypothetical protein